MYFELSLTETCIDDLVNTTLFNEQAKYIVEKQVTPNRDKKLKKDATPLTPPSA